MARRRSRAAARPPWRGSQTDGGRGDRGRACSLSITAGRRRCRRRATTRVGFRPIGGVGSSRRDEHMAVAGACAAAESRTQRGRRPAGDDRRGRRGTTRSAGSGGGVHPAIILTHSRALGPGATPGNRRRNSTTADSSPSSVNTRRMAAACFVYGKHAADRGRRPAGGASPVCRRLRLEASTAPIARPKSRGVPWMPFVKLYRHSAGMTRAKPRPAGPAARRARLIRRRGRSRDPEHDGTFGIAPVTAGAYRPAVARHPRLVRQRGRGRGPGA